MHDKKICLVPNPKSANLEQSVIYYVGRHAGVLPFNGHSLTQTAVLYSAAIIQSVSLHVGMV